ncbi:RNA-binding protein [Halolamina salifodinae]|uniref:RNA binding exosome subunit n=1 Tax=Halolamina salifodinae TaxID=1202767 RepID=A0A8T4H0V7_9EURY|nr:RNA-binding protein [Halolamina salifodinae]MBP1987424.1 RNA binding exosome subunit [Halolamina salifodinae]
MPSVPFHYVDLRTFCYATEDEKRVEQALRRFLPEEYEIERAVNSGHHGDRIVVFSARVDNADDVRHVLRQLSELSDIETVIAELDERVDDNCAFFLRLDKQDAFKGTVDRGPGITLRAKVEAYPAKQPAAVENAREALEQAREHAGN